MNEPNEPFNGEEGDALLEGLFKREHTHLPAEPFSSNTLQAIAAERKRAALTKRVLRAAGLAALVALSPLLIDGSAWLSTRLDGLFVLTSSWLATPFGMGAAALAALAIYVARRVRVL